MAPRPKFALIFSDNPPAADVINEKLVIAGTFAVGEDVTFQYFKSQKQPPQEVQGKILKIGTGIKLKAMKVNCKGDVFEDTENAVGSEERLVGNRKKEEDRLQYLQNYAKENQLQIIADGILSNGPDSIVANVPAPPAPISRLPTNISNEEKTKLAEDISKLPMWQAGTGRVELMKDKGIWVDAGKLSILRRRHQLKPATLFRRLIKLLMTRQLLIRPGISSEGKRGCLPVPNKLKEAVNLYVSGVYRKAGGDPDKLDFDPAEQITNLIHNLRREAKRQPRQPVADEQDSDNSVGEEDFLNAPVSPSRDLRKDSPPIPTTPPGQPASPILIAPPHASPVNDHSYHYGSSPSASTSNTIFADLSSSFVDPSLSHEVTVAFQQF